MSGARIDLRLDERAGGSVAYLTLDNQAKLNTLDRALMNEFIAAVDGLASHEDLRALVLSGAGDKAFIGGANIPEMAALTRDTARDFITLVHETCACLRRLPVPVINEVFTPTSEQIDKAKAVVAAFAANPGAGAVGVDGKMYDRPHLVRAQALLARVKA